MNAKHFTRLMIMGVMIIAVAVSILAATSTGGKQQGMQGKGEVMKQLNLTPDQQARIKSIHEGARKEADKIKSSNLTEEQKRTQLKDLHKRTNEQVMSVLTPAQRKQLEEARKQHPKGTRDCAAQLTLTDKQKDQAKQIRKTAHDRVANVRSDSKLTQDQKRERVASILRVADRDFQKILTPQQQTQYRQCRSEHHGQSQNTKKG